MFRKILTFAFILGATWIPVSASAHGGADDDFIIRLTSHGLEPQEMTVIESDEVLFINNDTVDHTLTSSQFESPTIKSGESWKYTFSKVGTWKIYESATTTSPVTMVVLEDTQEKSIVATIYKIISSLWHKLFVSKVEAINKEKLEEFKSTSEVNRYSWLEKESKEEGPEVAWRYVQALYNSPEGTVAGNAHAMAHLVGQLLFKARGLDGLSVCTPDFAFGCYHGLMEVAFDGTEGTVYTERLTNAQHACTTQGDDSNPSYWSCIHGIGHGIATYRKLTIAPSLSDCEHMPERVRTYCTDGVFMELSINGGDNLYNTSDPLYPCTTLDTRYQSSCARAQVQVMKRRFSMSDQAIARDCVASQKAIITYHCIDALGYSVGQTYSTDPAKVIRGCGVIADKSARAQCLAAAAGELVFQNFAHWQENVIQICNSLEGKEQEACTARVNQIKTSYGRT